MAFGGCMHASSAESAPLAGVLRCELVQRRWSCAPLFILGQTLAPSLGLVGDCVARESPDVKRRGARAIRRT